MGKNRESRKPYSQMVVGITALMALTFSAGTVRAASFLNSCTTYCHGAQLRDGIRKGNPHFGSQSSAFPGNHRNHLPSVPTVASCNICHTPVVTTDYGHQNNIINMANSLKGYSSATLRAKYDKGVFFNQTSIPNLTNARCSNTSCHFEKQTPLWGSPAYVAPADCAACHGAPPAGTAVAPAGGLAGSHARHNLYYPGTNNCQKCHADHVTFTHATSAGRPLKVQGYLRNPLNALEAGATYSGSGNNYLPSKSGSQLFGNCSNLYCHSSGQNPTNGTATGATYKTVAWGAAALTCAGCHVDEANDATGTGSHKVHTIATGANYDCVKCHLGYTKTTVTTAKHVNSLIELGAAGFTYSQGSGATHPAANGFGTCSASACHGTATITWGSTLWSTTDQCGKCHSSTTIGAVSAGTPFYSTSYPTKVTAVTDAKVGAHTSHIASTDSLSAPVDCAGCHGTTTLTGATHMTGTTNFVWSSLATKSGALAPTYTTATRVCANVYCHGAGMPGGDTTGTNKTPTWNVAFLSATISRAACAACHGFPPPTTAGHPAVTIPATWPVAGIATAALGTTCNCHANISSSGTTYANIFVNKAQHINGTVEVSGGHAVPFYAHATPPFTSCTGCHNASATGIYPAAAGAAPNCRGCHTAADPTVTASGCSSCHTIPPSGTARPNVAGSHVKHSAVACATCHNGAGAGSGAAHGLGNAGTNPAIDNIVFTAAQAGASATWTAATKTCATTYCHGATLTGGTAKNPVWGTTLTGCGTCHGFPPATSSHTGVTATQCIGCHSHVNATGTGFSNAALHMNGVVDASGGISSGGAPCYACHAAYNVMNSSTASFHHVMDAVSPDQAPNTGTYPSSQTVLACTSCHMDHNYFNSNKGANLRTSYNAAAGSINNHDFSTAAPYGLCVSCHSTAQTKGTAQLVAGTTTTIAIDGSATAYQASMHNYTATSLFGTSKFSANCVKCHSDEQAKDKQTSAAPDKFGTHYSIQRSLLNTMGATPQAAAGADFCYRCHSKSTDVNPGGGVAKSASLKDYFGSKAMTAASEDIFSSMQRGTATVGRHNVSGYKGLHKDTETRADIAAAKHVECTDCHDPHLAKTGRHTAGSAALAGVLTGASGVGVTTWGANWAGVTASAYNPSTTTAPLITATAEWQVCFKCHSGANANATTWGGTGAAAFTDLALEFNPNNASSHPVVAALPVANRLTAARLTGGWVPGSVMTCSDCHATDSTASKGPHGSSVKWMLSGTNKAWPYTTTAGNGASTGTLFRIATYSTGAGTANGLFCLNCHTIRPATGVNSWHSNSAVTGGQHGSNAIMACASCHLRVPHGGKISRLLQTTNAPARYRSNGSTATSSWTNWGSATVNIKGSAFSNANFKSSCGEHSGSGGEAW